MKKFWILDFGFWICLLALVSACGQQVSSVAQAAPVRAFVASDFENNAAPDSDEIEVPIIARDPFQTPDGLGAEEPVAPARRLSAAERAQSAAPIPARAPSNPSNIAAPSSDVKTIEAPQPIEVTWPDIRLSGVLCDARGRWMAVIDGNVVREGEWITHDVKLAHVDQNGIVLIHRTGVIRRIKVKDGRENA